MTMCQRLMGTLPRKPITMGLVALLVTTSLSVPTAALAAKKVKLEVWTNCWSSYKELVAAFKGFEKQNPGVTVSVSSPGTQWDIYSRLLLRVASGTAPDLINVITPIAGLSERNLLAPLNAYLKTSKAIRPGDYSPDLMDIFNIAGNQYALPAVEVGPWLALCYNKANFERAGLDPENPARTLEDLKAANLKLTRVQDGKVQEMGLAPTDSMGSIYYPETWGQVFGAKVFDGSTHRVMFDTPEMAKAVDYTSSFSDSIGPRLFSAFRTKAGSWGDGIAKGLMAMEVDGYWTAGWMDTKNPKGKYGYTWVPNVRGDKMMVQGGWGFAIPKGAKNPEVSWKLMEYMASKEPSQAIFDQLGFLNGNRRTLKELDLSKHPNVKWFLDSVEAADRTSTTPDVPEWLTCKGFLQAGLAKTEGRTLDTRAMLKGVQQQVDATIDKFYKQTAKYKH